MSEQREEQSDQTGGGEPLGPRVKRAVEPLLAGVALDLLDLATFGPFGLGAGLVLGALAGWALAPSVGAEDGPRRWGCAALAGLYCAVPGTSVIPLASILAAITRFEERDEAEGPAGDGAGSRRKGGDVIDVDFRRVRGGQGDE